MAHIRTVKPEFFTDHKIIELGYFERLVFIGLWTQADRAGRMVDNPRQLKIMLFPEQKVEMERALHHLMEAGLIQRYCHDNCNYIQIRNFEKHQRPHHTEKPSEYPLFNGDITVNYPLHHGELTEGREGKGRERKGSNTPSPNITAGTNGFDAFWTAYPKKVGKADAFKAWSQNGKDRPPIDQVLSKIHSLTSSPDWSKDNGQFIPHPATWIRRHGWHDESTARIPKPPAHTAPKISVTCKSCGNIVHDQQHSFPQHCQCGQMIDRFGAVLKPRDMSAIHNRPEAPLAERKQSVPF